MTLLTSDGRYGFSKTSESLFKGDLASGPSISSGMSDLGCYVPEKNRYSEFGDSQNMISMNDSQYLFDNSPIFCTPEKDKTVYSLSIERKRKISSPANKITLENKNNEDWHLHITPPPKRCKLDTVDGGKRIKFDADSDSSDEETPSGANVKRTYFQQTRNRTGSNSMPADLAPSKPIDWEPLNRNGHIFHNRASLPHNWKIPEIKIIPSSPCLDPNHPDYPEFFEDKIYLESKTSSESGAVSDVKSADEPESTNETTCDNLATSPTRVVTNSETNKAEESSDSLEILSDSQTPSDGDELQSTPELDVIIAKAKNETERQNCINFAKNEAKRKLQL